MGRTAAGHHAPRPLTTDEREDTRMGVLDKLRNKKDELAGTAKKKAGETSGDQDLKREGATQKGAGDVKQAAEKVKDAFD